MTGTGSSERFDSATITLVIVLSIGWIVCNWPHKYVATAQQHLRPNHLSESSFDCRFLYKYEVIRGGFPFQYLERYEDDPVSRPSYLAYLPLFADGLVAVISTLVLGGLSFLVRRRSVFGKQSAQVRAPVPERACRAARWAITAAAIVAIVSYIALNDYSDRRLAQRLEKTSIVCRSTHVPSIIATVLPQPVLARFARIRGVISYKQDLATTELLTTVRTLTSFGAVGFTPTSLQWEALCRNPRFNHLLVVSAELTKQDTQSIAKLSSLRWLNLMDCSGLHDGLGPLEKLEKLRDLDLVDSDLQLASLTNGALPPHLESLRLPRPKTGSDSVELRDLPELTDLVIVRSGIHCNSNTIRLRLVDLPKLHRVSLETWQKFALDFENAPRLQEISYSNSELLLRGMPNERIPTMLWLESLRLVNLPSLRLLNCDGHDLKELSLKGLQALQSLAISVLAYDESLASYSRYEFPREQIQNLIDSVATFDGPPTIDFSFLPLKGIDLTPLAKNERIRKLGFQYAGIDGHQLSSLATLPKLTKIDLRGCPISNSDATQFLNRNLPLHEMLVSNREFEQIEIVEKPSLRGYLATDLPKAKTVRISAAPRLQTELIIGSDVEKLMIRDGKSLLGLSVNGPLPEDTVIHGIEELRFFAVGGEYATDAVCEHLWDCASLDHLTIAYGGLSRDSLEKVGRFKQLTVLALPGSQLDDEIVTDHWQGLTLLSDVDLSETKLSSEGVKTLLRLKNLQRLAIGYCPFHREDLVGLSDVIQLIELNVAGTGISHDVLSTCLARGMLDRLDLSDSKLDQPMLELLGSRKANSIHFLGLRNCGLHESEIRTIAYAHPLMAFDIAGNDVSSDYVAELRSQRRLIDCSDRRGFVRHLTGISDGYGGHGNEGIDPVRGRIDHHQFVSSQARIKQPVSDPQVNQ